MADPHTHAGTIDDPIPQRLLYKKKDGKVYTVASSNTGGGNVDIKDANESTKGVNKLSDSITSTADAATGVTAATPLAVKYVHEKVTQVEEEVKKVNVQIKQHTDTLTDHGNRIDALEKSGGNASIVLMPKITAPAQYETNVLTTFTITGSAYQTLLESDKRKHRRFEASKSNAFDTVDWSKEVDADSVEVSPAFEESTDYYLRICDVSQQGYTSPWSTVIKITTGGATGVEKPTVSIDGEAAAAKERPTFTGSTFAIKPSGETSGEHVSSTWILKKADTDSEVWKSENDTTNLTTIKLDRGILEPSTKYVMYLSYTSKSHGSSAMGEVEFTTVAEFTRASTPTIVLKGYNDSNTDIGSGLTIEGGEYSVTDGSSDTHKATSWSIAAAGRTNVWESLNDTTNLTSIVVPKGTLQKSTSYTVTVIYHGTEVNDSQPAAKEFTTADDFGTVQPPVITVTGEPNSVKGTPIISGGAFSNTRETDTHAATEVQIIKSTDQSSVWTTTTDTGVTSVRVPKGKLEVSTQYKVKMRYKGATLGWSEWAEKDFTTAAEFVRYNYIGVPGTSTFGVGLAPEEAYKSVKLNPADKCTDKTDFQYGLYVRGDPNGNDDFVAMKWIPKFYIAMLQKNEGTVNLTDEELDALLPYVEVTKDQMKEAQRRSPHNAMVVAPADRFTSETEANQHGFGLMRGFVDGGKEQDGFFISNTFAQFNSQSLQLGSLQKSSNYLIFRGNTSNYGTGTIFSKELSHNHKGKFISTLRNTPYQCCSAFAWGIISIISLIQGQYVTSTSDCAWYDSNLITNFPKGINSSTTDIDDSSVQADLVDSSRGNAFVTSGYEKTTHNGSITGITNVNGWIWSSLIGMWSDGRRALKRSASVYDLTYDNLSDNGGDLPSSLWESVSHRNIPNYWGGDKTCLPSLTGDEAHLFGVLSVATTGSSGANEFGADYHAPGSGSLLWAGGTYGYGTPGHATTAGVFSRWYDNWASYDSPAGFRAMAYPREAKHTVTINSNKSNGETKQYTVTNGENWTVPSCPFSPDSGKAFVNYTHNGSTVNAGSQISITSDTTLQCNWRTTEPIGKSVSLKFWMVDGGDFACQVTRYDPELEGKTLSYMFDGSGIVMTYGIPLTSSNLNRKFTNMSGASFSNTPTFIAYIDNFSRQSSSGYTSSSGKAFTYTCNR